MSTKLLYLEDFDVVACEATVLSTGQAEDGRSDIVLDQTCFYPRGGGQDWDQGQIATGNWKLVVSEVHLDENGQVHHIGTLSGKAEVGEKVRCEVDRERRAVNTRLHSAGHIIDRAADQLGLTWIPGRGGHYPHMSFVEYQDDGSIAVDEALKSRWQDKVDELAGGTYQNKIMFVPVEEMSKYCRHVPENIPTNKPSRIVLYADDFGIPCGGTHVKSANEIGRIRITKIKAKKGLVKVSYAVDGIN